jgi:hypothetical protein
MKITLELSQLQAEAVALALDFYSRMGMCQLREIAHLARSGAIPSVDGVAMVECYDQIDALCRDMSRAMGFPSGGNHSISSPQVPRSAKVAYEVERVLTQELVTAKDPAPSFRGCSYDALVVRLTNEPLPVATTKAPSSFQARVDDWMQACFGPAIGADRQERNRRFLEEALELVQAHDCSADEAHQLVDYVFSRPVGEPRQENGGVMVTLAALNNANGLSMQADAEAELARVWKKMELIRAKQAAKPRYSPPPPPAALEQ